ncbi:Hypothetical predicted protein [Marmota monax]|uniref:Olfactory receptor n=1 Tax=Marmota monax TaxID=9995 RepID=A0A5E4DBV5_MARMO|nr:hypothetical protein GHT09_007058 [Marmota monax]VTJ90681.1 Hypothetical predicted protein [Marmota monax]
MKLMDGGNHSAVSEFVLLGLTSSWELQILLFVFFTIFYVASMLGNLLIVLTIISDHHLHSPMYFLLANLSFIDTGVSSIATPKMIYDLFRKHKAISLKGCITQMFFIHTVGGTEMVLLIVMAYDRYVAICKPLHYLTIMSLRMCISLLTVAWTIGLIHSVVQLAFVINLPFCGSNKMDSFYCDFPRFIKLACTDTYRLEFLVTANSGFISMGTFFILIVSYISILVTKCRWAGGCGGLAAASGTVSPDPAGPGRRGEEKQWSREQKRQGQWSLRGGGAAAAAPLEAADVGEAVAAAAEAALRTRGKLLADRTPGRDVREPPLPPLTPERSWAREGDPVLPWPAGQPARGRGGKPVSARPGSGRRRPRSSSLGATWRAGGGGDALGLSLGRLPGTAVEW